MQFKDLRLKNIDFTIRYRPETNTIISRRRQNHIISLFYQKAITLTNV